MERVKVYRTKGGELTADRNTALRLDAEHDIRAWVEAAGRELLRSDQDWTAVSVAGVMLKGAATLAPLLATYARLAEAVAPLEAADVL